MLQPQPHRSFPLNRRRRRVAFFQLMISSMLMIMRKGSICNSHGDLQSYILLESLMWVLSRGFHLKLWEDLDVLGFGSSREGKVWRFRMSSVVGWTVLASWSGLMFAITLRASWFFLGVPVFMRLSPLLFSLLFLFTFLKSLLKLLRGILFAVSMFTTFAMPTLTMFSMSEWVLFLFFWEIRRTFPFFFLLRFLHLNFFLILLLNFNNCG